ncbi:hypothetical protein GY21_00860 [Cryobacterium roopkundense]|uniref:Uncharacterized protein n=1 Tax=Cryobacterium roopkundense TaxID=1001240 RepID=A0A099JW11_9MICO|nr:hypothetical protein [Cryobacterium roopkundense]KGJ82351.1 hypothetical protein GY21_00860 [Cryobacterium roopkundense]MBB5639514.1 hypothetical protein [Cryobacterium roopkundense]
MFLIGTLASLRDKPERGAALASVLGVMAVGLIFASLITASIVGAYGVSSATRSGVQSGAAADAGIAAARRGLYVLGDCAAQPTPGTYSSAVPPKYSATIEYYTGSAWFAGCPALTASQVRITSNGTAEAAGINGATVGNATKVEAVFKYIIPGVQPSGVALYLYKGGVVEANSSFDMTESPGAGLMVKSGNFDCAKNNAVVNGSVIVNGNLTFTSTCTVNGSAWVSGTASLGSGLIRDDLTAGAVSPNPPGARVGGTYTNSAVIPTIPTWTELGYSPTSWVDSTGTPYEIKTVLTPSACVLPNGSLGGTVAGKPLILNALGCLGGPTAANNTTVSLTSDVVIYANKFDFSEVNSLQFSSSTSALHKIWFITPDLLANSQPTCTALTQGDFSVKNGFAINDPIDALLYTPCAFSGANGFTWSGQIIAGNYSSVKNNPTFTFTQIGVPGVNLDTGSVLSTIAIPQPGAVVSIREISG